jgi:hypothetical protein
MTEQNFTIRDSLRLVLDTGIIVELGLRGGFKFSDTVVEQIRGDVIRVLQEADEQGGGEKPHRMMVNIADVVYVLFS